MKTEIIKVIIGGIISLATIYLTNKKRKQYVHRKQKSDQKTTILVNKAEIGETIETKVQRITQNNEPITDGATPIYTERKDGVLPAHDIRTDRSEVAIDAMDVVAKAKIAKRDKSLGEKAKEGMDKEKKSEKPKETGGQPAEGTDPGK